MSPAANTSTGGWDIARSYLSKYGHMSVLFTNCIRMLIKKSGSIEEDPVTAAALDRLLKSPSVFARFYHGVSVLYPDKITSEATLSSYPSFAQALGREESAALLGVIILVMKARKVMNPEAFETLLRLIHQRCELSALLGTALPGVGHGIALLTAALRPLSFVPFQLAQEKEYKEYLRILKKTKKYYSLEDEVQLWGCTHVEICSLLVQSLGFGTEFSGAYFSGFSPNLIVTSRGLPLRVKIASAWLDSLINEGVPPDVSFGDEFTFNESGIHLTVERAKQFSEGQEPLTWLNKERNSLSKDTHPEIAHLITDIDLNKPGMYDED